MSPTDLALTVPEPPGWVLGAIGHADTFELKPDEAGRSYLRGRLAAGGALVVVVVPQQGEVAATYFGAGSQPEANRPRLVIGPGATR